MRYEDIYLEINFKDDVELNSITTHFRSEIAQWVCAQREILIGLLTNDNSGVPEFKKHKDHFFEFQGRSL